METYNKDVRKIARRMAKVIRQGYIAARDIEYITDLLAANSEADFAAGYRDGYCAGRRDEAAENAGE